MNFCSVIIVDKAEEHHGLLANISFVLGLSASKYMPPETFREDAIDGDGAVHRGLTCIAHHVRQAGQNKLRTLRKHFTEIDSVEVTDYTRAALPSSYDEYTKTLKNQSGDEIEYLGIHLFGPEEAIVPKTKNLSRR